MNVNLSWKVILISVFFIFPLVGNAQKGLKRNANKAFVEERYYDALSLLQKAFEVEKKADERAELSFKIAECNKYLFNSKEAELWYRKAIEANISKPLIVLYLADALKAQGKYPEAILEYTNFLNNNPENKKALLEIQSCEIAQKWKESPTRYELTAVEALNSKDMDFCPTFVDKKYNQVIFTSTRDGSTGNKKDSKSGQNNSDLYESKRDRKGNWSSPSPLSEEVNSEDGEGAASVHRKSGRIYFTRCPFVKGHDMFCYIFTSQGKGGKWSESLLLQFASDTINVAHPAVSEDGTLLVFTSNLPGGQGGYDLWYVLYDTKAKTWSEPINLGPTINTLADEKYPYIHLNGDLYFSSNGHLGMGGLDIFKAPKVALNEWGEVENLKYPINSSQDDFGIVFEGNHDKGLLTSNREGSKSDDIYAFKMPPLVFVLQGTVTSIEDQTSLGNAIVKLIGSDSTYFETKSDNNGYYQFIEVNGNRYINPETSYNITASKEEFLVGKGKESTIGVMKSTTFIKDFALQPTRKKGKIAEINFPEVLYDLGQYNLREESKDSLDYLFDLLIDNPSIIIELAAHTDSRGAADKNKELSEYRAKSCVDYLISKGIPAERLKAVGYGEEKLKITDSQISLLKKVDEKEVAHQKNRRTVFSVISWDFPVKEESIPIKTVLPEEDDE